MKLPVVDAAAFSGNDKQKPLALVQSGQGAEADDVVLGAPAGATYKTHCIGIFDVLEEELSGLRKAETNTKHNCEMPKQSLQDRSTWAPEH